MAGIGIWQLLIVALIVVVLFGTKKLRNVGSDVGGAVKGFKKAMEDDDASTSSDKETDHHNLSHKESTSSASSEKKHDKEQV